MYSFIYDGMKYEVAILDTMEGYFRITERDNYCIYYVKEFGIFILKNYVIAKGNFRSLYNLSEPQWIIDYLDEINPKPTSRPIKEVKEENPEWFPEIERSEISMEFKTADTNETVLELSVPTIDELDNYFSSIGYNLSF